MRNVVHIMLLRVAVLPLLALVACEPVGEAPPASRAEPLRAVAASQQVLDGLTGQPVAGALVQLVGTTRGALTDEQGFYRLDAPAGFEWVRVTAEGYGARETRIDTAPRLWPLAADEAAVEAFLEARHRPPMDHDDLDDPDLTPAARAYLRQQRGLEPGPHAPPEAPGPRPGVLKQNFELPATIRIYRRGAENNSCQGRVDVIPLEEYVRGVVPHEWIASWHQESLNAGAVAARGYAVSWIFRGGKYDCADLDDTTRSQVYREDRDARGDAAVEATRGQVIHRNGEFVTSEYSAENGDPTEFGVVEPLCSGRARNGHGRGMCQWGTQRWATQRNQNYVWMVEHYYPNATVTRPGPPTPDVELRQRLARVDAQPCADPAGTYDCADFVRQGRSRDLFDLYVGQRMAISVELTNTGAAPSPDVELAMDLPGGVLRVDRLEVDGAERAVGDDTRPRVNAGGIAPGQTRTVRFVLQGEGYSPGRGEPARVRTWVASMGDTYRKPAWDAAPEVNEGQDFNGGDLRLMTELDVFDPHRWTWRGGDANLHDGWIASHDVAALRGGDGLRVEPAGGSPTLESPFAPIDAGRFPRVTVRMREGAAARIWWRAPGEGFDDARSAALTDGSALLAGAGAVEQIRLQLEGGAAVIDEVAFGPDAPGPGPDPMPAEDAEVRGDTGSMEDASPPRADAEVAGDGGRGGPRVPIFTPGGPGPDEQAVRDESARFSGDDGCRTAPGAASGLLALLLLVGLRRRR